MVPTSGELFTCFDPDSARFVRAYYEPLQRFLEGAFTAEAESELPMGDLPLVDIRLGLDLRAFAGITFGAPAIHDGSRTAGAASPERLFVGPDAVAVGLGTSWSPTSMRLEPADRPGQEGDAFLSLFNSRSSSTRSERPTPPFGGQIERARVLDMRSPTPRRELA
jgi:hypothetical protein